MTIVDDLRSYGLPLDGLPATIPVRVAGLTVPVAVDEAGTEVTLRASIAAPGVEHLPPNVLAAAGMAPAGSTLTGVRSLPGADGPTSHDAVFELAKSLVQMARLAEQWAAAGYRLEAPASASGPPATAPPVARWWGSVLVDTPIVSGDAARRPVGTLRPGQWYAVLDESGGWVLVDDGAGGQGWLGEAQLRRAP